MSQKVPPDTRREGNTKNAKLLPRSGRPAQCGERHEIISFICLDQEGETRASNSLTGQNASSIYSRITPLWFGSIILNPLSFLKRVNGFVQGKY